MLTILNSDTLSDQTVDISLDFERELARHDNGTFEDQQKVKEIIQKRSLNNYNLIKNVATSLDKILRRIR
jgi:hypothetical protein